MEKPQQTFPLSSFFSSSFLLFFFLNVRETRETTRREVDVTNRHNNGRKRNQDHFSKNLTTVQLVRKGRTCESMHIIEITSQKTSALMNVEKRSSKTNERRTKEDRTEVSQNTCLKS